MASGLANYGASYFLGVDLGLLGAPTEFWVGLTKIEPGPDADGDIVTGMEPLDSSYHRVLYSSGAGQWALNNGLATNIFTVDFPFPLADWGFLTHWALLDAEFGGNLYAYGILANPQQVARGYGIGLPPGGIAWILTSLQNSIAI